MYNKENDVLIWTNNLDYEDYRENYEAWMPDEDGYTEEDRIRFMNEDSDEYFYEEKERLDHRLGRSLVMIGTLGLWDGPRHGWKHLKGENLNDCLSGTCGDYVTWYVSDGDICCDDIHHDGTNHYIYRAIKEDISDWEFDEMMAEGADIDTLTEKLGHYVTEAYGIKA